MRTPPQGRTVGCVPPETLRIVLDVQVDGDAIVGHTRVGVSEPKPFSGWLGLIGVLDAILTAETATDPEAAR
jgi:hypothetical protein